MTTCRVPRVATVPRLRQPVGGAVAVRPRRRHRPSGEATALEGDRLGLAAAAATSWPVAARSVRRARGRRPQTAGAVGGRGTSRWRPRRDSRGSGAPPGPVLAHPRDDDRQLAAGHHGRPHRGGRAVRPPKPITGCAADSDGGCPTGWRLRAAARPTPTDRAVSLSPSCQGRRPGRGSPGGEEGHGDMRFHGRLRSWAARPPSASRLCWPVSNRVPRSGAAWRRPPPGESPIPPGVESTEACVVYGAQGRFVAAFFGVGACATNADVRDLLFGGAEVAGGRGAATIAVLDFPNHEANPCVSPLKR